MHFNGSGLTVCDICKMPNRALGMCAISAGASSKGLQTTQQLGIIDYHKGICLNSPGFVGGSNF